MKILLSLLILFLGMSIDMSAQTTMSASKKMNAAAPTIAQQTAIVSPIRVTPPAGPTSTTRGTTTPINPEIQSDKPTYPASDLQTGPNNPAPVSLPIVRKKIN